MYYRPEVIRETNSTELVWLGVLAQMIGRVTRKILTKAQKTVTFFWNPRLNIMMRLKAAYGLWYIFFAFVFKMAPGKGFLRQI